MTSLQLYANFRLRYRFSQLLYLSVQRKSRKYISNIAIFMISINCNSFLPNFKVALFYEELIHAVRSEKINTADENTVWNAINLSVSSIEIFDVFASLRGSLPVKLERMKQESDLDRSVGSRDSHFVTRRNFDTAPKVVKTNSKYSTHVRRHCTVSLTYFLEA